MTTFSSCCTSILLFLVLHIIFILFFLKYCCYCCRCHYLALLLLLLFLLFFLLYALHLPPPPPSCSSSSNSTSNVFIFLPFQERRRPAGSAGEPAYLTPESIPSVLPSHPQKSIRIYGMLDESSGHARAAPRDPSARRGIGGISLLGMCAGRPGHPLPRLHFSHTWLTLFRNGGNGPADTSYT